MLSLSGKSLAFQIYLIALLVIIPSLSTSFAQGAPHYPLHVNDRWEYSGELAKAIKDTIMPNGLKYTVIVNSDTTLGDTRFERFDSSRVFRYNPAANEEELWFDLTAEQGDTINVIKQGNDSLNIILTDVEYSVVLKKPCQTWRFELVSIYNGDYTYIEIADNLGIIEYLILDEFGQPFTFTIKGAYIDSTLIREEYPYIYLPFKPGNWWKLDGFTISVIKDTTMPDDKTYSMLEWGTATRYYRQENHFVYRYDESTGKEILFMDMSAPSGQIWDINFWYDDIMMISYSGGIKSETVFSESRKTYNYGSYSKQVWDVGENNIYADNFGPVSITSGMVYDEVVEAYVDGVYYGGVIGASCDCETVPREYKIEQNYPNPFNPSTAISYQLPEESKIFLEVYNLLGEKITTLIDEVKPAGFYTADFNGKGLPSGIYIYRITASSQKSSEVFSKSAKMTLIK